MTIISTVSLSGCGAFSENEKSPNTGSPAPGHLRVYLNMLENDYQDMTLHVWNNEQCSAYKGTDTDWNRGLQFDGVDDAFGAYWDLPILDSTRAA